MRLDLHMHSRYSCDSFMDINRMIKIAKKIGLDGIAITDHNRLPRVKAQEGKFYIIPGEEILTRRGEVIGHNLTEKIPPLLSLGETLDRIHEQGGFVHIPHPFNPLEKCLFANYKNIKKPFLFEVFNGNINVKKFNKLSRWYAEKHRLPMVGSSDAHDYSSIGNGYTELETHQSSIEDIFKDLLKGKGVPMCHKVSPRKTSLDVYLNTFTVPLAKALTWFNKKNPRYARDVEV